MDGLRASGRRTGGLGVIGKGATVAALALSLVAFGGGVDQSVAAQRGGEQTMSAQQFHDQMRKLWEDHITYTRLTLVSLAGNLADLRPTEERLLRNQADLGDGFRPYYGDEAADHLTELLRAHILTAIDIVAAAKAGDAARLAAAKDAWYDNAIRIADFLHELNPDRWGQDELRSMMKEHLDLTLREVVDRLRGDFGQDIADFDQVHAHILGLADLLSCGIIEAFPADFR